MNGRRRPALMVLGIAAVIVFGAYASIGPLVRIGVGTLGRGAGYVVTYDDLSNAAGHLTVTNPVIAEPGRTPVFAAQRIDVAYDLGHLLGGPYLYGVSGVEVDRPRVTIVRSPDGSFNFALPSSRTQGSSGLPPIPKIRLAIVNGSVGVVDDTRIFAHSRRISVGDVHVDADVDPHAVSHFTIAFKIAEDGGTFPVDGRGTLDETRGYESSRITARSLALAPLIDYALNSTSLHVAGGVLNDVDARVYGLPDAHGTMQRHLSVTANLDHFQPYLNGITKPLRDGRGALRAYDDGLAIPRVDGSIAGVPVRIAGGIYHLEKPVLRLGIVGTGDLRNLLTLSDAAKAIPVAGPIAFRLFVEGDAAQPTTLATFVSPGVRYGRIPIDRPAGLVALHGQDTAILRTSLGYDGTTIGARGNLHVEKRQTTVDILADVAAPPGRLPYASLLGTMPIYGDAVLAGTDKATTVSGVVSGQSGSSELTSTFAVAANGTGSIGPLAIEGPGSRELYARVAFDRPKFAGGAAFVQASDFSFDTGGAQPNLPGIVLPAIPRVSGTLDAGGAGAFDGPRFTVGGVAHGHGIRALGYPIDDVVARATITAGDRVAIDGRYRGALAPLARAAGSTIVAAGNVDVPIALVAHGMNDVLAQVHDARFDGVTVGGVAIAGFEGTARIRGKVVDLYGARARIAGHDVVAQGRFGDGGTIAVSTSGLDLASLRGLGIPVTAGAFSAVAAIGGSAASPRVDGDVAASDLHLAAPQVADLPIDASTGLRYAAGTLAITDALVRAGPAVGSLDGHVDGLRGDPRRVAYAFAARVRHADVATLAHIARADAQYPEGTLDADLAVTGSGASPRFTGDVAIPEGSLNGLGFKGAAVSLRGTPAGVSARGGRVTVGTSTLGFDADISQTTQSISLRAPHVDLADFNDYFDAGDTLGGTGSIAAAVANAPSGLTTSGRIRLADTRYRRFDVGASRADWSTTGRTVRTDVAVGDAAGTVTARGNIVFPASQPLRDAVHRSSVDLVTRASHVELATWLPVIGVHAPVTGSVNANATVRGSYPDLDVVAHGDLANGMAGRIPIRTATLDARATQGRATISNAVLAIDEARATLSGSAGFTAGSPFDLTLIARTPDVGALARTLTTKPIDLAGTLSTTAHFTGTIARPLLADSIEATQVRYAGYTLPRAHAEIALTKSLVRLQAAELDLQSGRLLVDGYAPITVGPSAFGIEPPDAPLALDFTAERVDFTQFEALLPKGTELAGLLDGKIGLVGSLAHPGLAGTLAVTGGSFVGPEERSKISNAAAQITFDRRTATLHDATANVGGGTVAADGSLSVPDLTNPAASAFGSLALRSTYAVFDVPGLLKGRVNGSVTLARAAHHDLHLDGNLDVTSARIPTAALLSKSAAPAAGPAAIPVGLDLTVSAGDDVRVQGGPVDIGAKGDLTVGGTLAAPTVAGELDSTGGTISLYRTFQIQYPTTVTFDGTGVIPNVDALATTSVDSPPTDVTLHVTGPATRLNVAFTSDPSYSREQIVGLLVNAQALGAVSGIAPTPGSGAQQNPFTAVAQGQLGNLLTQNVLEPFSSQLGSAIGLGNLAINYTPGGGASVGAQKKIFKNVNAVFAESFNYPQRQSLGFLANTSRNTAAQLTFFSQPANNRLDVFQGVQSLNSTNDSVTGVEPATGTSGFSFSLQRKF